MARSDSVDMERAPSFADASPGASAVNSAIAEAWERELTRFELCGFGSSMGMRANDQVVVENLDCTFDELNRRLLELMGETKRLFGRTRQKSGTIRVWIEDIEVVVAIDIHPTQDRVEFTLFVPREYALKNPL